jgi:hypothetical protein
MIGSRCPYTWEPGVIAGALLPTMHCTAWAQTEHQHMWTRDGEDFWASIVNLDDVLTDAQLSLYAAAFKGGAPVWPT